MLILNKWLAKNKLQLSPQITAVVLLITRRQICEMNIEVEGEGDSDDKIPEISRGSNRQKCLCQVIPCE